MCCTVETKAKARTVSRKEHVRMKYKRMQKKRNKYG